MDKYIPYASYDYAEKKSYLKAIEENCCGLRYADPEPLWEDEDGEELMEVIPNATSKWWGVVKLKEGKAALVIPEREWAVEEPNLTAWQLRNLKTKEELIEEELWIEKEEEME